MNDIFAWIKMFYALMKETSIEGKLIKHQLKMVDLYNKYSKRKFKFEEACKLQEELLKRLQAIRRENERKLCGGEDHGNYDSNTK